MKSAVSLLLLAALLSVALVPGASAAPLTASWQIETRNESGETTTTFEPDSILNITIYPPQSLATGGIRSLIVWSQADSKELVRYSLGYYANGNQTETPKNVSVNLGAFYSLIRGDNLLLQIRSPIEAVEFTAAISVSVDVEALLEEQKQFLLSLWSRQQRDIEYLRWQLDEAVRTLNNYLMVLGIVIGFVVAYVTRDHWLNKKRKDEVEKSTTEFEQFLEAFILEHYQSGDKGSQVKPVEA